MHLLRRTNSPRRAVSDSFNFGQEEEIRQMRSRSLEVPLNESEEFYDYPFIIGQTGIKYQIFNMVGSGSYGEVFDVEIVQNPDTFHNPGEQPIVQLVAKIIECDEYFDE